jgi:hypothetical protein
VRLARHGFLVDVPRGWDVRVYRRTPSDGVATTHGIVHAANFALPESRGDYGSGAVELMTRDHVFISLVEFHPSSAGTALFERRGVPTLDPAKFSPRKLQRTITGQAGCQSFFNHRGRAFCLFVVVGDYSNRVRLVQRANELVAALDFDDAAAAAQP